MVIIMILISVVPLIESIRFYLFNLVYFLAIFMLIVLIKYQKD